MLCVCLQRLIAFRNATSNTCYIDRLDETFEEGYARWQGYEVYSLCVLNAYVVCVNVWCVCVHVSVVCV